MADSREAHFPQGIPFRIISAHTGLLLTPRSERPDPSDCRLTVLPEYDGEDGKRQLWQYEDGGFLRHVQSNLVLDYETGNFAKPGLIHCCVYEQKTGQDAHNQRWLARTGGLIACQDDINRVLDVRGASTEPGAEILLHKLKTVSSQIQNINQRFRFEPAPASLVTLKALPSETLFDANA